MSGGSDISCLRGFRTPCCFFAAVLILVFLGLTGYGLWRASAWLWRFATDSDSAVSVVESEREVAL